MPSETAITEACKGARMHGHQVPRASTESQQRHSSAHVHEGWLLVGRSSWIALVALTLGIFTASFPVYVTQLHTFCVEGPLVRTGTSPLNKLRCCVPWAGLWMVMPPSWSRSRLPLWCSI